MDELLDAGFRLIQAKEMAKELAKILIPTPNGGVVNPPSQVGQFSATPYGGNQEAFLLFDSVLASGKKVYVATVNYAGKVIGGWFQFYNTEGLLGHYVTLDGAEVFKYFGTVGTDTTSPIIALHDTAVMLPANLSFNKNAKITVESTNTDVDAHLVRVAIFIQKATS